MMKWLLAVIALIVAVAIGLGIYLQPNSLAQCPSNGGKPLSSDGCAPAEAIIAISGGDTSARTKEAVRLYELGWAPLIIFSGAAEDKTGPSNAMAMRSHALSLGVPESAIWIEEDSENTRQNAERTRELLQQYDVSDIILVTSGYHQRRASLEFAAITRGESVTIRNAPTYDRHWTGWWWATPNGWYLAVSEFVRIIAFYARGGSV